MTTDQIGPAGFAIRRADDAGPKGRNAACAQLIATIVLAVSTVIAATAVSIGMARAGVAGAGLGADRDSLAAMLMAACALGGLAIAAMAGWAALARGGCLRNTL